MNSRMMTSVALLLSVLAGIAVFCFWRIGNADRQSAKVQRAFEQAMEQTEGEDTPNGKRYRIENADLGDVAELDSEQQIEIAGSMMERMIESMTGRYQRILDLPRNERNRELDKAIDAQRQMTGQFQEAIAEAEATGASGSMTTSDQDGNEVRMQVANSGPEGERFLGDNTTPQMRATMEAYKQAIHDRIRERGMDPTGVPITMTFEMEATSE